MTVRPAEPDEIDLDDIVYVDENGNEVDGNDPEYEYEDPDPEITKPTVAKRVAKKAPTKAAGNRAQRRAAPKKSAAKKTAKRAAPRAAAAVTAVQAEGEDEEFAEIEHDGLIITIPADVQDWPIEATYAFEQGQAVTAVRELVGDKGFEEIRKKRYTNRQFTELFEKIADVTGFGNSGN